MGRLDMKGQQAPKGFRQKSKKELAEEQLELYKAQQEEGRRKAMENWYRTAENYILGLMTELGFPAHANLDEKRGKIVAAFMHQAALIVAGDKDGQTPEEWGKAFTDQIIAIRKQDTEEKAQNRTEKMAAVVAALIYDPSLDGGTLDKSLKEPWLGLAKGNKAITREARESEAFGKLVDVKLHDQAAAIFLRRNLDQAKDYTPAALKAGLDRLLPELAKEREPAPEAPKEVPAPDAPEDVRVK